MNVECSQYFAWIFVIIFPVPITKQTLYSLIGLLMLTKRSIIRDVLLSKNTTLIDVKNIKASLKSLWVINKKHCCSNLNRYIENVL